jgi:zinc transporter, ZIP family
VGVAFLWGLAASSSLLVGGLLALWLPIAPRVRGWIMAFGAGVLISAVAYELFEEAFATSENQAVLGAGLFIGSAAFYAGDTFLDRKGAADRKRSAGTQAEGAPLPIVLGIVLDGIPESMVIGLTLLQGGAVSLSFLAAVFVSNVPEAIAATTGLATAGWRSSRILLLWGVVAFVSGLAAAVGYGLFDGVSPVAVAFVLAFAAGALLTMLADTMMPEAFEHGGKVVGVLTTVGFAVAFALSLLG